MLANPNPKIIGAFVVGFALVAGAYTISNFKKPESIQVAAVAAVAAPLRETITVVDRDENGIEDWRDEFVTAEPIRLNEASSSYTFPTTYTGRLGIDLIEGVIHARSAGPFGRSQEEVISDTVDVLAKETAIELYDVKHVQVMQKWNENDIKNYANSMAGAILGIEMKTTENELFILSDILTQGKTERMGELESIALGYKTLRDKSLTIPVPALFLKQHLDLINTYNALHHDIDAMTLSLEDPVVALMSIKRYEDGALGLELALQNMFISIKPYSGMFTKDDPATLFATFSEDNQGQ